MRISYLLAAALALGMVPGRAVANEDENQSSAASQGASGGAADCSQCQCGQGASSAGGSSQLDCSPCPCQPPSTGGTGAPSSETNVTVITGEQGQPKEKKPNEGLGVALLGGVEGYTSSLAPRLNPGGGWGLMVTAQPTPIVGLELAYSGANNRITDPNTSGASRIIRTGGQADLKFSLLPRAVEPYLFGGIGIEPGHDSQQHTGLRLPARHLRQRARRRWRQLPRGAPGGGRSRHLRLALRPELRADVGQQARHHQRAVRRHLESRPEPRRHLLAPSRGARCRGALRGLAAAARRVRR